MNRRLLLMGLALALTTGVMAVERTAELPLREIRLFSCGLGSFTRGTEITGPAELQIHLPARQMDDLLKSLMYRDPAGALESVRWVHTSPLERLQREFSLALLPQDHRATLLGKLAGAAVTIRRPERIIEGRLVGLQPAGTTPPRPDRMTVRTVDGFLHHLPLDDDTHITLREPGLAAQLAEVLAGRAADLFREAPVVNLQIGGEGRRGVELTYLTAMPAWDTSYRMVIDGGGVRLIGWATAHNVSDEDWRQVALQFVSGRPLSYDYNLRLPVEEKGGPPGIRDDDAGIYPADHYLPSRTLASCIHVLVKDETGFVIPGATVTMKRVGTRREWSGLTRDTGIAVVCGLEPGEYILEVTLEGFQDCRITSLYIEKGYDLFVHTWLTVGGMATEVEIIAEVPGPLDGAGFGTARTRALGEIFAYTSPGPVDLAARHSLLLPFVNQSLEGEPVAYFEYAPPADGADNMADDHNAPVLASVFVENTTPLVLEEGTCSVYAGTRFRGEGFIKRLVPREKGYIHFGLDPEVTMNVHIHRQEGPIRQAVLSAYGLEYAREIRTTYAFPGRNRAPVERVMVLCLAKKLPDMFLSDECPAWYETPGHFFFRRVLAADSSARVEVPVTWTRTTILEYHEIGGDLVEEIRVAGVLPGETVALLERLVDLKEQRQELTREQNRLAPQSDALANKHRRIRGNLSALGASAEERQLRQKYLRILSADELTAARLRDDLQRVEKSLASIGGQIYLTSEELRSQASVTGAETDKE
ncbi:MAG: hypothetical protein JXQ27_17060 [Acidobacteria bacterium]|nr:hypothetical protein [Acidobacteriota bacterium]